MKHIDLANYEKVVITVHNFGLDINGNTIARNSVTLINTKNDKYAVLCRSIRRAQVDCNGHYDDQCDILLIKCQIDRTKLSEPTYSGSRAEGQIFVTYHIKNDLTVDQESIAGEFDKLNLQRGYKCRLKIASASETNWINISDEQLAQIKEILMQSC